MKKQIATFGLLLTCVSCSIHLKAQISSPIHVGLKAGGTFSKVSTSDNFQGKYNFGYQAGAMVRLDLGSAYLQGETLFNKRKSTLSKDNANADLSWNSIDLPVTIGYKIVKTEDVNVRAFAGGVYSYSFGKEISGKEDIEKAFSNFDKSNIGLTIGLGVDVHRFSVDFRYENGLTNISKDFKSKPKSFSLGIGYFLF